MKIFRSLLPVMVLFGSVQEGLSQYYLKSGPDSLSLASDSVFLLLRETAGGEQDWPFGRNMEGTVDWQSSADLVHWTSLDKHGEKLGVRIDSTAYYRAKIVEGGCDTVISDTALLIEKVTITGSNEFTVDSMGGVFLLPSGIKVKVPRGAVRESESAAKSASRNASMEMKVEILGFDEANSMSAIPVDGNVTYLSGVKISSGGFDFTKPVKIKIPVQNMDTSGLPLVYKLDTVLNIWKPSTETFMVFPEGHFIELFLEGTDLNSYVTKGAFRQDLKEEVSVIFKNHGGILTDFLCRELGFTSQTEDYDFENSGGCAVSKALNKTIYHECGSKEEFHYATEIAPGCKPELKIFTAPGGCLKIKKGVPNQIELSTSIGGLPLPYQTIKVTTSSNISASSNTITRSDGTATISVSGNETGDGSISLSGIADYYLSTFDASGAAGSESDSFLSVQKPVYKSVCVTVIDVPEVTTTPVVSIDCNSVIAGGNVTDDNLDPVTDRGVIVNNARIPSGSGLGQFSNNLTGAECEPEYHVQAYAINSAGIGVGNLITYKRSDAVECKCIHVSAIPSDSPCKNGEITLKVNSTFNIIERGIFYGKSPDPETTGKKLIYGSGEGTVTFKPAVFEPFITYYIKGYATTPDKTYYGDLDSLRTAGPVTDRDGNVYNTVLIGNQFWMAENLRTPFGIQLGPGVGETAAYESGSVDCGCYYNAKATHAPGLCPTGWHVPHSEELFVLTRYLVKHGYNYDGDTILASGWWKYGKALAFPDGWKLSDYIGDIGNPLYPEKMNTTCFSVRPCGYIGWKHAWVRDSLDPNFFGLRNKGELAVFGFANRNWLSGVYDLVYYGSGFGLQSNTPDEGINIRCIKDSNEPK